MCLELTIFEDLAIADKEKIHTQVLNHVLNNKHDLDNLIQVLPDWKFNSTGSFSFVFPAQKYASPKVKSFIELALDRINKT